MIITAICLSYRTARKRFPRRFIYFFIMFTIINRKLQYIISAADQKSIQLFYVVG